MNAEPRWGISRQGLDAEFEAEEARKSRLLLEAAALRAQGDESPAADRLAEAAAIEHSLASRCEAAGLQEKSLVHRFSAAGCWAQAGDFHHAITLCDQLLSQPDLPEPLRKRIGDYAAALRARRAQWYAGLTAEPVGSIHA